MLFVLGTNCGLRISDLLSLNVGDVRNKSHIQIIEKKTGKFKKFPINDRLKPMIENFVKGRRNAEPLFLSHWKHRLDRVTAYYLIRDACEKAGLQERIGTHSMRKTFGYHHYQQFKDVVILQKIFNHSKSFPFGKHVQDVLSSIQLPILILSFVHLQVSSSKS